MSGQSKASELSIHYRQSRIETGVSHRRRSLVYGFGVNDADYMVGSVRSGVCPAYSAWRGVIRRCYSDAELARYPTYRGCSVDDDWRSFMKFREWYITNHKDGWHLDKDLLLLGNKVYGPKTCVFVPPAINLFLTDHRSCRGALPIGVSLDPRSGRFYARAHDGRGRLRHVGCFNDEREAHEAWALAKLAVARNMKSLMDGIDERIYLVVVQSIMATR